MERYYQIVLDLFKEAYTNPINLVNPNHRLEAMKEISNAIITARINDQPTNALENLLSDVKLIRTA